jgi:hypothetical protein
MKRRALPKWRRIPFCGAVLDVGAMSAPTRGERPPVNIRCSNF